MKAVRWAKIEGGQASFDAAYAAGALLGAVKQQRFAAHLDSLGAPGAARWDPAACEIELRGQVFHAEQIGSFDGESWLWSWANTHLALPDTSTTYSRSLRDSVGAKLGIAAFAVPMIAAADERLPYMMGSLALAHTDGEGYYIANQSQVYVLRPGQLPEAEPALDELRTAIVALQSEAAMPRDVIAALPFAAKRLGFTVAEEGGAIVVRHGDQTLSFEKALAHLRRLGVCFLKEKQDLDAVLAWLAADPRLPALEKDANSARARGDGWEVRVTVETRLRAVMREANALPSNHAAARNRSTVVVVETHADPALEPALVPYMGSWAPASMMKDPMGKVAGAAIGVCERLNAVPGALLYDAMLKEFYPPK